MTTNDIIKETRALCRAQGMTLKRHTHRINGKIAYYIAYRNSGRVMFSNMTLISAWETSLSDAIRLKKPKLQSQR